MHYFFCNAYLHLYYALDLNKNISKLNNVTVLTYNISIYKFCESINMKVIYFNPISKEISLNIFRQLWRLIRIRKESKELIKKLNMKKNDIIIYPNRFFLKQYAGMLSYILFKLQKISKVYIADIIRQKFVKTSLKHIKNKSTRFRLIYKKFLDRIVFGTNLHYYKLDRFMQNDEKLWLGFNNNFGVDHIVGLNRENENNEVIKKITLEYDKILNEEYDHLILYDGDGNVEYKYSSSSLEDIYRYIFSNIKNYAIKRTPKILQGLENQLNIDIEKNYNCIPSFLPSELLYKNIKKSVISVGSSSLHTVSYHKNIKAVSLVNLVSWNNEERKKICKNYLLEKNKDVLFPNTYSELFEILND